MSPFQASNIGFGLPRVTYHKVEIVTTRGQACYVKVGGAQSEGEAVRFAMELKAYYIAENGGVEKTRVRECGQFEAVLQ